MTSPMNDKLSTQPGKVFTLSNSAAASADHTPQKRRHRRLLASFLLCVLMPLIAAAIYYAAFATDRYAASAGFSIRGIDAGAGIDGIGALTGLASSGSTTSDSYIVLSYLSSRELLEAVDERLDLRGAYTGPEVDVLSRLAPNANIEDFLKYWQNHIHTQFSATSGIIEFEVQSFSREHARDVADAVLSLTQSLVNNLSASARNDALTFARREVELQEARLRKALGAIRDFRASEQSVDPAASAALDIQLIASLEARLIDVNARIAALRETLDQNAPSLTALLRTAQALETQIAERRQAIGPNVLSDSGVNDVTQQLALYEELEVERSIAQQAYASALVSLEKARVAADRQQRYLAIHLRPQAPDSATYPRSIRNLLIFGFALIAAWGIGTLLTYSVRDHLT
jgi:capsular polysaccharide transport system permease protein